MSSIWKGPFGEPVPSVQALSIDSTSDIPLTNKSSPENKNGINIEFKRYPDFSLIIGSATIFISLANLITSLKYLSSVLSCFITSAVLFFHIELAKWSAKNISGLPVYLASLLGSIVDEFVTTIVFLGSRYDIFVYKSFFMSKSSVIDSITRSAFFIAIPKSISNLIFLYASSTFLIHSL